MYTLTSPLHDAGAVDKQSQTFLAPLNNVELDNLIYVCTGGTENEFMKLISSQPSILSQPIYLLASGDSNSLAASVEILSWLQQNGYKGEILHGTSDYIIARAKELTQIVKACKKLYGQRAGIIGKPSDWLISSIVDKEQVKQKLGIELIDIPIEELLAEIEENKEATINCTNVALQSCDSPYFEGAMHIYYALNRLIDKYHLSALTLRCFDLLSSVRNTGCLALALLNSRGIPAACEGDVPALLTMMIANALTGQAGFQANPSRIDINKGEVLFAHCTAPLNMLNRYNYDTHFESGIGVAIHGELPLGKTTVCKVSGDLKHYFVEDVILEENTYERTLCRTQIVVKAPQTASYILHHPIGNHQIILSGHYGTLFASFMKELNIAK